MSRNKRGGGADHIYSGYGWPMSRNPSVNREVLIERVIANRIIELAMNRFKWDGLPDSIDPRFLEMTLFKNGLAVYYKDDRYDKEIVVRGSGTIYSNVFDNPIAVNTISPGLEIEMSGTDTNAMTSKTISAYDRMRDSELDSEEKQTKAVLIWPNYTRTAEWDVVQVYAPRLAKLDRTIEINTNNARRSRVLKGTPQTQLTVANIARGIDQGDDMLMVTGPAEDLSFIDSIDLGVTPDQYEKLHILRTRTWNECMGLLGIDNANQDKKERLVAAEVGANDSQTDSMRFVALNARRQACKLINEVFGRSVTVDFNTEIEARENSSEQDESGIDSSDE